MLGAGGGHTIKKGAPRRSAYLMPRVARRVRNDRAALLRLLEAGNSAAMDATQAENDDAASPARRAGRRRSRG